MSKPTTLYDKIWDDHVVHAADRGRRLRTDLRRRQPRRRGTPDSRGTRGRTTGEHVGAAAVDDLAAHQHGIAGPEIGGDRSALAIAAIDA